jgi:hypothetical protein
MLASWQISRFPRKERLCMPGSATTPGCSGARVSAPVHVAFRHLNCVGARGKVSFAAQWLACTLPCRRFACILTDTCARLGVDVVRYTFIAMDLHHLLLAGLPAHSGLYFILRLTLSLELKVDLNHRTAMGATNFNKSHTRGHWTIFSATTSE